MTDDGQQSEGQVSEVGRMDPADADTPISDDQSVAGSPSDESGDVDEGPTGSQLARRVRQELGLLLGDQPTQVAREPTGDPSVAPPRR